MRRYEYELIRHGHGHGHLRVKRRTVVRSVRLLGKSMFSNHSVSGHLSQHSNNSNFYVLFKRNVSERARGGFLSYG
jgi:hypothetical protein